MSTSLLVPHPPTKEYIQALNHPSLVNMAVSGMSSSEHEPMVQPGVFVIHATFGKGQVMYMGNGDAGVLFMDGVERKLRLKYAKLEVCP